MIANNITPSEPVPTGKTSARKMIGLSVATVLGVGLFMPTPSQAFDGFQFDVGKTNICIGFTCMFKTKTFGGRNTKNEMDHRYKTRDHRPPRKNTVVNIGPKVRDHRTKVRDHRTN